MGQNRSSKRCWQRCWVALGWLQAVSRGLDGLKQLLGEPDEVTIGGVDGVPPISGWNNIFRVSQAREPHSDTRCMGWLYRVSQVHEASVLGCTGCMHGLLFGCACDEHGDGSAICSAEALP